MDHNYIRKDRPPQKTISIIEEILEKNGIRTQIIEQKKVSKQIYSVRIELCDIKGIGTNGKGITGDLALASAYAELMERLQSGFLIRRTFLTKKEMRSESVKGTIQDVREFMALATNDKQYIDDLSNMITQGSEFLYGEYAEDLCSGETRWIPLRIINMLTHSNGLCAGNTKEEAVIQGICEIFERYCMKNILCSHNKTRIIKYENPIIEEVNKMGFVCEIRDCSMGKFPVVGILVFNKEKTKYLFSIGADPCFDIAIQRCITELFQGNDRISILAKMRPLQRPLENNSNYSTMNWLKWFSFNGGVLPMDFFSTGETIEQPPNVFLYSKSTRECYDYILSILKKETLNVFCVNLSCLGFPTYRVYIPTLSEVEWLSKEELSCIFNREKLSEILFSTKPTKKEDITFLINQFIPLLQLEKYSFVTPKNFFHTENIVECDLDHLSFPAFITILALYIDDYELAKSICRFEIKKNHISEKAMSFYNDILNDSIRNVKLKLPHCPSCFNCKVKRMCSFKKWYSIAQLIYKDK